MEVESENMTITSNGPCNLGAIGQYVESHQGRFIEELRNLIRQPSISSQNKGVKECAELIRGMMQELGIEAQVLPTGRPTGSIRSL